MASNNIVVTIMIACLVGMFFVGVLAGGDHVHKKVIIHVPYKIHHIHHTHTVYKHVGHEHKGDDHEYYKVIGYSGGVDNGIEGHGGFGGGFGGHSGFSSSGSGFSGGHY